MPALALVVTNDTFLTWRTRTNELIAVLNMPLNETNGVVSQLSTRADTFDITASAGVHIGCVVTDNGDGSVAVAAGEGLLRNGIAQTNPLQSCSLAGIASLVMADLATNFIYADYLGGVPTIKNTIDKTIINGTSMAPIATVVRDGIDITILQQAGEAGDFERRMSTRLMDTNGLTHAFGADLNSPSGLTLTVSAGEFYYGQAEYVTSGFDTSIAGTAAANIFERYFTTGPGLWTTEPGVKDFNPSQYNGPAGLVAMTPAAGLYSTAWIYMKIGSNKQAVYVLYGSAEHASIADARAETPPQSVPYELKTLGVLLGRAILQEGNLTPISIDSVLNKTNFASSATTQFDDSLFALYNSVDATKRVLIDLNNTTSGTTRTLKTPNKSGTLATIYDSRRRNDEVFYHASMGMLGKRVVPYPMTVSYGSSEDNTSIFVNGIAIDKIHKDMIGSVGLVAGDIIESNNPLAVKDTADGHQLTSIESAAENFMLWTNRLSPHSCYFYSDKTDAKIRIYKDTTNYSAAVLKTGTSLISTDVAGTYIEIPCASGEVCFASIADDDLGHQYIVKSDAPIVFMKDGTGGDAMSVFPMSREYLCVFNHVANHTVAIDGVSTVTNVLGETTTYTAAEALAGTVVAPTLGTDTGFHICDTLAQSYASGDGAGTNALVGIPLDMLGDRYLIDHDLAGYDIVAVEPTIIKVYGSDNLFTTHDLSNASKSNPMKVVVGNTLSGVHAGVPALQPSNYFLRYNNRSSNALFTIGETITGATSGATAIVAEDKGDVLILESVSTASSFVTGETVTGGTSTFTASTVSAQYATWHFKGTAPFAVRVNDPADDEYIAIGFEQSKRVPSGTTDQLSTKISVIETEVIERAPFVTNFNPDMEHEWVQSPNTLGGHTYIDSNLVPGSSGPGVRRMTGQTWMRYGELVPFNPDLLYKVSCRVRLHQAPSIPGTDVVFLGLTGYLSDKITMVNVAGLNNEGNQSWVGAASISLANQTTDANGWVVLTGYVQGYYENGAQASTVAGAGNPAKSNANDPLAPSGLHDNTRFFSPTLITNWVSGDGITDIDYIRVERAEADAHAVRIDNPHNVTPGQIGAEGADLAIQAHIQSNHPSTKATLLEAQTGSSDIKAMTPLRTLDAIKSLAHPNIVNDVTWMSKSNGNVFSILMNGKLYNAHANSASWNHHTGRTGYGDGRMSEWGIRNGLAQVAFPEPTAKIVQTGSSSGSTTNCFALFDNGNLYMWGDNRNGQCGMNHISIIDIPVLSATNVTTVYECTHMAVYGYHSRYFIKKTDGTIQGAGANHFGAVGVGSAVANISTWTTIPALGTNTTKMFVLGGYVGATFALKSDGTIWACGNNGYGSLGDGTTTNRTSFVDVTTNWGGSCSDILQMGGGFTYQVGATVDNRTFTNMLRKDQSGVTGFYTCGNSTWGTRGNGTTTNVNTIPFLVPGSSTYVETATFGGNVGSVYARTSTNQLYVWGHGGYGQYGLNNVATQTTPVLSQSNCAKLWCDGMDAPTHGHYTTGFYQATDGLLYGAGYNPYGQLGNSKTTQSNVFTKVLLPENEGDVVDFGWMTSTGTTMNYVAKTTSGKLYVWGYGGQHNISQGQINTCPYPVDVRLPN